jgi:hypothetical protein
MKEWIEITMAGRKWRLFPEGEGTGVSDVRYIHDEVKGIIVLLDVEKMRLMTTDPTKALS